MATRILIADDHGVLRAGLRALLNADKDMHVVDEAPDGDAALRLARVHRPDVVVLDMSMPGPGGVEVVKRLRESVPKTRVLVLTVHEDPGLLREVLRAGAAGYVVKRAVESELLNAIHAVSRGEIYVHPSMTRALLPDQPQVQAGPRDGVAALSPREVDVLKRIARGYTNRQIADELHLSVRTVETHRANLMGKLGLESRVELVRWAAERKLLD
ncbi:MAG: response regulator [Acidobacteriota bacterium]